jgi:hypothetical protein
MKTSKWMILPLLLAAPMLYAQTKSVVVEEVVARVNNDVITQEDLAKARDAVQGEVQEECRGCTPEQIQQQVATKDKNVLRDLIDQSLLVQLQAVGLQPPAGQTAHHGSPGIRG